MLIKDNKIREGVKKPIFFPALTWEVSFMLVSDSSTLVLTAISSEVNLKSRKLLRLP